MKMIPLTRGLFTIVDDEDFEELSKHSWCAAVDGYAIRRTNGHIVLMHRVLTECPNGLCVDHKDGNPLNNQKKNLRTCTRGQNAANRIHDSRSKSGFWGVFLDNRSGRWQAEIKVDYKKIYIGSFESPEDAARARDAVAIKLRGEFARLNFPSIIYSDVEK